MTTTPTATPLSFNTASTGGTGSTAASFNSASFSIGQHVDVAPKARKGKRNSEGGRAVVLHVLPDSDNDDDDDEEEELSLYQKTYNIQYVGVNNGIHSQGVEESRLSPVFETTARKRKGETVTRPSLLSKNHIPFTPAAKAPPKKKPKGVTPHTTVWYIDKAKATLANGQNAGLEALTKRNKNEKLGWLREKEGLSTKGKKHHNENEKKLVLSLLLTLQTAGDTAHSQIAHAWGYNSRKSLYNLEKKAKESGTMDVARKKRKDAGDTVFTSDAKRDSVYTARNAFEKLYRAQQQRIAPGEPITNDAIKAAFQSATPNMLASADRLASSQLNLSVFLIQECSFFLKKTNGTITWRQLATKIAGEGNPQIICKDTIRKYVMSLPESTYQTTRIHPLLNQASKGKRYNWAQLFWLFWNAAKALAPLGVQIFLVHMDEKWFYSVVVPKNNKRIPFLGIEPVQHSVHHKSHIYKIMGIASSGFLPLGNDMERGGEAIKVSLVRAGKVAPAAKDTYRQVYKDDGTFHYPKIPENLLRKKGDPYFKPMEITGSNEGTKKEPKFPLLKHYLETEIPRLEVIAREYWTRTGRKLLVRYQIDGAGCHTDQKFLAELKFEFDKRGWILVFQPPNSPLTNIKDACVFPAMSKAATAKQGMSKGSHVLQGEELWDVVQKVWTEFPEETIARSFLHHHQMANAIIKCKGGDEFAKEHKGLHCNIRKLCIPYYGSDEAVTPSGVEIVQSVEDAADLSGLKYEKPVDCDLPALASLSFQELECLLEHLEEGSIDWDRVATAITIKHGQLNGEDNGGEEEA